MKSTPGQALLLALLAVPLLLGCGASAALRTQVARSGIPAPHCRDPWRLDGPPTLDAAAIEGVLAAGGSPAAGQGAAFYAAGLRYGIDPAFALAFFAYESSLGTDPFHSLPGGQHTHNIGNITCTPGWQGHCKGRFRVYPSWEAGIDDWFRMLRQEYVAQGRNTLERVLPLYAPPFENDTARYISASKARLAAWRGAATTTCGTHEQPVAAQALAAALPQQGRPYRWGAAGPDAFDCSGLVQWSYGQAGVAIPRTTETQWPALQPLPLDALRPGDLLFFRNTDGSGRLSHVGLYAGDINGDGRGDMLHAASAETGVLLASDVLGTPYWREHLAGARRVPIADSR